MSDQDCRRCKNWRDCQLPPDWFNYAEIRWCPWQIIWIISHTETLKAGHWPIQEGTSDTSNGNRQFKTEASFVKPEIIIAELEARIERTGIQGKLLMAQVQAGNTLETFDREAWQALMYIKGWRRKKMSFSAWKSKRKYQQKGHEKVTILT